MFWDFYVPIKKVHKYCGMETHVMTDVVVFLCRIVQDTARRFDQNVFIPQ